MVAPPSDVTFPPRVAVVVVILVFVGEEIEGIFVVVKVSSVV